jgi:hypothetical protein
MRDQIVTKHGAGGRGGLIGVFHHLDATALTTAAGMNLRLDDAHASAQLIDRFFCLFGSGSDNSARHSHAEALENFFGLELVDIHQ